MQGPGTDLSGWGCAFQLPPLSTVCPWVGETRRAELGAGGIVRGPPPPLPRQRLRRRTPGRAGTGQGWGQGQGPPALGCSTSALRSPHPIETECHGTKAELRACAVFFSVEGRRGTLSDVSYLRASADWKRCCRWLRNLLRRGHLYPRGPVPRSPAQGGLRAAGLLLTCPLGPGQAGLPSWPLPSLAGVSGRLLPPSLPPAQTHNRLFQVRKSRSALHVMGRTLLARSC